MDHWADPVIIQGGMGAGVSAWPLARAVALAGQLGVVSGTALDAILSRRLQLGDPDGNIRRAIAAFPCPAIAESVLQRHFIPDGKRPSTPFRSLPLLTHTPSPQQLELHVVANFVEVYLAKEGHHGLVGINYLEKIQTPTLPSLFGAILANVDYVLMGAGIPLAIPAVIESLCTGNPIDLPLRVDGADSTDSHHMHFDPRPFLGAWTSQIARPRFFPIVASATLATMLVRKARGRIDGFIVEGPTAGGHNAPPRGAIRLNPSGEPIYGDRDVVNLDEMRSLDRPFWLAGSYGTPERVVQAMEAGAAGVQVGTAFAFCRESGLRDDIKRKVIRASVEGQLEVFTDPVASPTGFPFKVLQLEGTLSHSSIYESRQRHCDLGYLRQAYKRADGSIGWRCPAEPVDAYVQKGGRLEHTVGRKCLCNALVANIGLEQLRRVGGPEMPLLTCGDCVNEIHRFLPDPNAQIYSARDVVSRLTSAIGGEEKPGALACRQL